MLEEMRRLTQEIVGSYDSRATAHTARHREVSAQRQAAQSQLQEMGIGRRQAAGQQRTELAEGRADLSQAETRRKAQVNSHMREVASARAEAQEEWRHMAANMHEKRAASPGPTQKADLTPLRPSEPGAPEQQPRKAKAHRARR